MFRIKVGTPVSNKAFSCTKLTEKHFAKVAFLSFKWLSLYCVNYLEFERNMDSHLVSAYVQIVDLTIFGKICHRVKFNFRLIFRTCSWQVHSTGQSVCGVTRYGRNLEIEKGSLFEFFVWTQHN